MTLAVDAIDRFRTAFEGELIDRDHADYDAARRLWNARFDRRPAVIARPASTDDVRATLRFAREQGLPIAVRCGGHSNTGWSGVDDGVVIDLRNLAAITIDPERRRARVGGGALLKQLDVAAQAHGLVCPVGVVGHTGVGGLTLGGGMGRLMRNYGLTIDHLRSVELVTADGRLVTASTEEEPDLFWAIRGAGTNFGIVTTFEFELSPFGGVLHRGNRIYPGTRVHEVWDAFRAYADDAPDAVAPILGLGRAEPGAGYPDAVTGQVIVVIGFNHSGEASRVAADIEALDRDLQPVARTDASAPYLEVQVSGDDAHGWGGRSAISGGMANEVRPAALDALVAHSAAAPAGIEASFGVTLLGGAIARVPEGTTSFGPRGGRFDVSSQAGWTDPALDAAADRWVEDAMAIVGPDLIPGRYVNEISQDEPGMPRSIYADRYDRLAALKRTWDPDNVFHGNQNIEPAAD
ncbi:MAG TPA: FAD-binding oxidoreductase [Candidatus Limnocylindrales bacterium]